jgi:hypothetical protein
VSLVHASVILLLPLLEMSLAGFGVPFLYMYKLPHP